MKRLQKVSVVLSVLAFLVVGFVACAPKVENITKFEPMPTEGGETALPASVVAKWENKAPESALVWYKINGGEEKSKAPESKKLSVTISNDLAWGAAGTEYENKLHVEFTLKDKDGGELAKGAVTYEKKQ